MRTIKTSKTNERKCNWFLTWLFVKSYYFSLKNNVLLILFKHSRIPTRILRKLVSAFFFTWEFPWVALLLNPWAAKALPWAPPRGSCCTRIIKTKQNKKIQPTNKKPTRFHLAHASQCLFKGTPVSELQLKITSSLPAILRHTPSHYEINAYFFSVLITWI